ncbi:coproporphyrinogen-III oxidase family protein [Halobacteriovorax sp. CON-3]|uniref:coproporphyrinogen-III oxidase family protein n=1 Tax=Halobacteriovorax sp. CON-3 TaxID=3157710 RepID=UPI003721166D
MEEIKSLYIHFPFCRHLCNYCDFFKSIKENDGQLDDFERLFADMSTKHKSILDSHGATLKELESLYIGGGTPSLWGSRGAYFLRDWLSDNKISLKEDCEFTLEVNPGAWTEETLSSWRSIGANRYSLGVQSLNPNFLKIIDRVHNIDDVHETLKYFNKGNYNFSVDFMIGLPFSKKYNRDIIAELTEILTYNPSHISLYILTVPKHYKHYDELPDEEWISDEYIKVSNFLAINGFKHYEVSNFAKADKASIHNLNYWKMESVAAIGPSATGYIKNNRYRYKWKTKGADVVEENLNEDEFQIERLYMNLRSSVGFPVKDSYWGDLSELVQSLKSRGLAMAGRDHFYLTSRGFLILDSIIDEIFKISK